MLPDGNKSARAARGDVHELTSVQPTAGGSEGVSDSGGAMGEPGQEVLPVGSHPPVKPVRARFRRVHQPVGKHMGSLHGGTGVVA